MEELEDVHNCFFQHFICLFELELFLFLFIWYFVGRIIFECDFSTALTLIHHVFYSYLLPSEVLHYDIAIFFILIIRSFTF